MFNSPKSAIAKLLSSVSVIAVVAGCSGPFDPNGGISIGLSVGTDRAPSISIVGDLNVGTLEEEVEPEPPQEENLDNIVYRYHDETVRNLPVDPFITGKLSEITREHLPPGTLINVVSGGQDAIGTGTNRIGSTRHDVDHYGHGGAVDFYLSIDGEDILPPSHPEIYETLIFEAAKFSRGIGHYAWVCTLVTARLHSGDPTRRKLPLIRIFAART